MMRTSDLDAKNDGNSKKGKITYDSQLKENDETKSNPGDLSWETSDAEDEEVGVGGEKPNQEFRRQQQGQQ